MDSEFGKWFKEQYGKLPNASRAQKAKKILESMVLKINRVGAVIEEEKYLAQAMQHALYGWNAAQDQISILSTEVEEQARLNGMGSEREARLMAKIEELKKIIAEDTLLYRG